MALDSREVEQVSVLEAEDGEDAKKKVLANLEQVLSTLPRDKGWTTEHIYQYQGFWFHKVFLEGVILAQKFCFKVRPGSIMLVTCPKSGTTWLKALVFSVFNRAKYSFDSHPLLFNNPHDCMPFLEGYTREHPACHGFQLPSIFQTHVPYTSLPDSILASGCKIIYMHRDPKDVLVSYWKFATKLRPKELPPLPLEEAFQLFARGVSDNGPYWDHVLGYWKASLECPNRMLFLTYEVLQNDPVLHVKKIAEFIGLPFSLQEEGQGVVSKTINLCSFENLSNLEVNKTGKLSGVHAIENNSFFRRGEVGDWKNNLTAEMVECLDRITEEKYEGTGLFGRWQVSDQTLDLHS